MSIAMLWVRFPATPGYEDRPVIGFIAHVDTSPDMSGANIKPQIIENYDGKDIRLNENLMMTVKGFSGIVFFKGTYVDYNRRDNFVGC